MATRAEQEIVLLGGRIVQRSTNITEVDIGDAAELISKYIPKDSVHIGNLGYCNWDGTQVQMNILISGNKFVAYCLVPHICVNLMYEPIPKMEFVDEFHSGNKKFGKDIMDKVDGWKFTGRGEIGGLWDRKIKVRGPMTNETGQFMFAVDGTVSHSGGTTTALGSYTKNNAYFLSIKNRQLRSIRLSNHYPSGRVCMGNTWDAAVRGMISPTDIVNASMASYLGTTCNQDLWHDDYETLWSLEAKAERPYWMLSNEERRVLRNTLRDTYGNDVLNREEVSLANFIGII